MYLEAICSVFSVFFFFFCCLATLLHWKERTTVSRITFKLISSRCFWLEWSHKAPWVTHSSTMLCISVRIYNMQFYFFLNNDNYYLILGYLLCRAKARTPRQVFNCEINLMTMWHTFSTVSFCSVMYVFGCKCNFCRLLCSAFGVTLVQKNGDNDLLLLVLLVLVVVFVCLLICLFVCFFVVPCEPDQDSSLKMDGSNIQYYRWCTKPDFLIFKNTYGFCFSAHVTHSKVVSVTDTSASMVLNPTRGHI